MRILCRGLFPKTRTATSALLALQRRVVVSAALRAADAPWWRRSCSRARPASARGAPQALACQPEAPGFPPAGREFREAGGSRGAGQQVGCGAVEHGRTKLVSCVAACVPSRAFRRSMEALSSIRVPSAPTSFDLHDSSSAVLSVSSRASRPRSADSCVGRKRKRETLSSARKHAS